MNNGYLYTVLVRQQLTDLEQAARGHAARQVHREKRAHHRFPRVTWHFRTRTRFA